MESEITEVFRKKSSQVKVDEIVAGKSALGTFLRYPRLSLKQQRGNQQSCTELIVTTER